MEKNLFKLASRLSLAMVMALLVAVIAPQHALADDDDPPSRVARLGYTSGSVSFQPAGTDDWVNAVINRPITTGDKLWADNDSRAELHLGAASIRMASNTGFSFLNLTDNNTQIRLSAGTLRIRVKRLDDNENFEIDTPNLAFSVLRPGVYKIRVNENGDSTEIRVRNGEGEVTGGGSAYTVHAREVGTFNGNDQLVANFDNYSRDDEDDFDGWNADRDRHEDLSLSSRYVSPDVIGYQDLDDHGWWRPVPEYGYVWFPHTTVVDWAPYRYGHWAYVYPWGYTWIDDEPWGFAPFHYGRWINYGGVWGWVPCPPPRPQVVYVRPVYAPALVAWVGGPHFGVGIAVGGGGGNVGWFPLGPREVYVPSYPVSRTYIQNVNVSNTTVNTTVINNYYNNTVINRNTTVVNNNVTVIHQTYVNQSVQGAVTATTPQAFTSAQSVSRNVVRVDAREVASAPVSTFTPPVAPVKQAVLGGAAVARVQPPVAVQSRAVVAKVAPPPPPVPFVKQQQAIQANGGKPIAIEQARQIQAEVGPPAHQVKVAPPAVHQNPQGNPNGQNPQGGFRPFSPSGKGPGNAGASAGGQQASGDKPGAPTPPGSPNNPGQPAGGYKPGNSGNTTGNFGGNAGNAPGNNTPPGGNQKSYNDRPQSARPNTVTSPSSSSASGSSSASPSANSEAAARQHQLDQKQQQQLEDLKKKQDEERQTVEQKQIAERQRLAQQAADESRRRQLDQTHDQQRAQQAADEARQRQLNQKHDQQLQDLEVKHDSQQSKLEQKQQDERRKVNPPPKSSKDDHSKDDHSKDDHSHHDR